MRDDEDAPMNRRTFLVTGAMAAAGSAAGLRAAPPRPRPSRAQLAWQRDELALFLHFGVNTFTDREWGDGKEDPAIFDPSQLDASQWARAARAAGARSRNPDGQASRRLLPLADEDDDALRRDEPVARRARRRRSRVRRRVSRRGFASGALPLAVGSQQSGLRRLAPVQRSVLRSAHRAADALRTDRRSVVRRRERRRPERKEAGLRLAARVGARAEAAAGRGHVLRRGPGRPLVRQRKGSRGRSELVDGRPPRRDVSGRQRSRCHGGAAARRSRGIRVAPGRSRRVDPARMVPPSGRGHSRTHGGRARRSVFSVRRPERQAAAQRAADARGLLHDTDVTQLTKFRDGLEEIFRVDAAAGRRVAWRLTGEKTATAEIELARSEQIAVVRIEENIARGQAIAKHVVTASDGGEWRELARGTTVGYTRLHRFEPTTARRVRVTIEEAAAPPEPVVIKVYPTL